MGEKFANDNKGKATLNPYILRLYGEGDNTTMPKNTGKYDATYRKNKLEEIRKILEKEGYTLHSTEYVNNRTKLEMTCPNGHKWEAPWDAIRANKRCKTCYELGIQKARLNKKRKPKGWEEHREKMLEQFRESLAEEGYTLKSDKYLNNRTKLPVVCPQGHEWEVSWNLWSSGNKRCRTCFIESLKLTTEEVAERLEKMNLKLLSEYKGVYEPLKYRCTCGFVTYSTLHMLQAGHKCKRCGSEKARITMRTVRVKKLDEFIKTLDR